MEIVKMKGREMPPEDSTTYEHLGYVSADAFVPIKGSITFSTKTKGHGGFHENFLLGIPPHMTESELTPKRIVRNGPALVVFWQDGTKTVVKCRDEDFDAEKGLGMALARKIWGRSKTLRYVESVEDQNAIDPKKLEEIMSKLTREPYLFR